MPATPKTEVERERNAKILEKKKERASYISHDQIKKSTRKCLEWSGLDARY